MQVRPVRSRIGYVRAWLRETKLCVRLGSSAVAPRQSASRAGVDLATSGRPEGRSHNAQPDDAARLTDLGPTVMGLGSAAAGPGRFVNLSVSNCSDSSHQTK